MHDLQWDDYRYIAAVGHAGSLSAAARRLGVHHSTVFRRIAAAEAATGVRLFDRLPEGYRPTPAGETVLAILEDVEAGILTAECRLTGAALGLGGQVRVTTTEDIAAILMQPHLARFHAAYPDIQLELVIGNRFFSLSRREADVAIRPSRDPEGDMIGRRVCAISAAAYGAPSYLTRAGRPNRPAELRNHRLVTCDDTLSHLAAARWMKRFENADNVVLRSNSFTVQSAAVRAGVGIAVLPCFVADDDGLTRLWPPPAELAGELWVLTHRDLRRTPRIRAVLDFFYDVFVADRARLEATRKV